MEQRLQKILSAAGVCSRRKAEEYLQAGRVTVNGVVAALGDKADPDWDQVAIDGRPLSRSTGHTYIMLHKPRGYVTTLSDEKGRRTVAQLVSDCPARVWPVGRLDMDSEGLLLLTDDGELTQALTHPSHWVEKEYHVHVGGDIAAAIPALSVPMELDGELLTADRVEQTGPGCLSIVIHQGKNRQVRRMCDKAGLTVKRLIRVREGGLLLGDLKVGTWRFLKKEELALMK
ncbi:MAG TPA: rRNA pseudouridine synthase [Candidatus Enterenecus stercoripullorum]|nr:rRNA pseudouridine synthase [Candidatus Enterenecus stercoripullorum]